MKKVILLVLLVVPITLFAQKFGHVDSNEVLRVMPEYAQAQNELQTLAKQYEDELRSLQEEGQKKFDEYTKERETLPANIRERREAALQELEQRIQQSYQDNQQALQNARQEKLQKITEIITKAIREIGDAEGFVYIMDLTAGIPYISNTLSVDLTDKVITKLGLKK